MDCPDILPTILDAAAFLHARGIAYVHLAEADWDDADFDGATLFGGAERGYTDFPALNAVEAA